MFGIPGELFKAHPNELPFVLKKRLGIALAVLAGKPWLIFDEPTLGQDEQFPSRIGRIYPTGFGQGCGCPIDQPRYLVSVSRFPQQRGCCLRIRLSCLLENRLPLEYMEH